MRKPKPNDQTEWWVKKQIKQILEATGWKFWMPSAGIYGFNGVSDFLCMKSPGLFMTIEAKYDDTVTASQFKFLTEVHEAGHYALLVDEINITQLRALLMSMADSSVDLIPLLEPFLKWQQQNPVLDIRISKP